MKINFGHFINPKAKYLQLNECLRGAEIEFLYDMFLYVDKGITKLKS